LTGEVNAANSIHNMDLTAIQVIGSEHLFRAKDLSDQLQIPIVEDPDGYKFVVEVGPEGVAIRYISDPKTGAVRVDFLSGPFLTRLRSVGKRQPLARALGLGDRTPDVLDATAGLGADAFVIASMGCRVTAVESSPLVFVLLDDGLRRAIEDPRLQEIGSRIEVVCAEGAKFLLDLPSERRPDVVYLDPMFPSKKKKSLPKKEMQLFQKIGSIGSEPDLFQAAIKVARTRVVVKRPTEAPPLAGKPTHSFESKLVRFDMYLVGTFKV
jgi:16S rRNA (guanine1516-N2)-methyltransferase